MAEKNIMKDAKGKMNEPLVPLYEAAKKASNEGKLKLVEERIVPPYDGAGFELGKGRVIRKSSPYHETEARRRSRARRARQAHRIGRGLAQEFVG